MAPIQPQLCEFRRCDTMTAEIGLDPHAVTQTRAVELSQSQNPCSEITQWANLLE